MASEYITVYWLGKHLTASVRIDNRYSYAKWIVLNYMWSLLGSDLKKVAIREAFRLVSERQQKYYTFIKPLHDMCLLCLKLSINFYVTNKKIDGKIQEPIDFFKHRKFHLDFRQYIKVEKKSQLNKLIILKERLVKNLEEFEY